MQMQKTVRKGGVLKYALFLAVYAVTILILPRILAGERLTKEDLAAYGEGGLCRNCEICRFPECGFGKN